MTRFLTYAREAGISHVLFARTDGGETDEEVVRIPAAHDGFPGMPPGCEGGFLLVLPDFWGSVLVMREGYALVAGNSQFTHMLVGAGVDEARAKILSTGAEVEKLPARHVGDFRRATAAPDRVFHTRPGRPRFGCRRATHPHEFLAEGEISGAAFATGWLAARNRAMAKGERTRGALDRVLTDVFYALEDYVIDPALREPGDLSDRELTSRVHAALDTLRSLEAPPPDSQVL